MNFDRIHRGNYAQALQEYTAKKMDLTAVEILDYIAALNDYIIAEHNNLGNALVVLNNSNKTIQINTSPILVNKYLSEILLLITYDNYKQFNLDLFNNKFDMLDVDYLVNNKQDNNTDFTVAIEKTVDYKNEFLAAKVLNNFLGYLKYDNTIKALNLIIHLHEKMKY